MRLWSLQPNSVLETLELGENFHCDPNKSSLYEDDDFKRSYAWLMNEMQKTIKKPDDVKLPVWAWYRNYGKHVKPDRRRSMFSDYEELDVILELEVPDSEVILSDYDDWHYVLNNFPYQTDDEYEKDPDKVFTSFEKEATWHEIFNIVDKDFIQACFWEIKPEYLMKAHRLRRKTS